MQIDDYGYIGYTEKELIDKLRSNPKADISKCFLISADRYNKAIDINFSEMPHLTDYSQLDRTVPPEVFHAKNADVWLMPDEYKTFDIAKYLLEQCSGEAELQRMGEELLLYVDRGLLHFLCYLKYMIDTFRKHNIVMGLGRGSSVASFALYKLGVHKINSLEYDLDIREFLKDK